MTNTCDQTIIAALCLKYINACIRNTMAMVTDSSTVHKGYNERKLSTSVRKQAFSEASTSLSRDKQNQLAVGDDTSNANVRRIIRSI